MSNIPSDVPAMTLRRRMVEDMSLHRLSRATQRNYLRDVARFASWLGRPPDTATDEDLRRYQIEQNQTRFFKEVHLQRCHAVVSLHHFITAGFQDPAQRPARQRRIIDD